VVIVVVDTHSLAGESRLPYLLALIASVVAWSFGTLVQKRAAGRDTVLGFTCVQMLFGGSFQLAMSFADGEWSRFDVAAVTLSSLLAVAYLIVFGSIIALTCYLWLLTRVAAPKVTTYALVNPVVALVLGALILDERITALAMTAAVLVLAGVALVLFQDLNPAALWRGRQKPVAALAEQTRK
jgi:drug/metabolite transporter (DMT)-like permease